MNNYEDKSIIEEAYPRLQDCTSQGSSVRYQQEEPQVQDASGLIFMLNKHKKVAEYQKFCVPLHAF